MACDGERAAGDRHGRSAEAFRRWTGAVLAGLLWCGTAVAAQAPSASAAGDDVLIVDNVFDRLDLAMFRQGFQRLPEDDEVPYWTDPRGEAPALRFSEQRVPFGEHALLWVEPETYAQARQVRAKRMQALTSIVSEARLQALIREAAAAAQDVAPRVVFATEAGKASVVQVLDGRDSGTAMVIRGGPIVPEALLPGPVALSWDDRQILLWLQVQRFRKVRGKHMTVRDLGPPIFYDYVGAPVPEGEDPLAWWSADDGARLQAALREGFERIFRSARAPLPASAPPDRASTAAVLVGGQLQRFPGVVIDRDAGQTRLALGKREVVLVRTPDAP